jgi:hypothetical protein
MCVKFYDIKVHELDEFDCVLVDGNLRVPSKALLAKYSQNDFTQYGWFIEGTPAFEYLESSQYSKILIYLGGSVYELVPSQKKLEGILVYVREGTQG